MSASIVRTATSVAVALLILVGCGDASLPPAAGPAFTVVAGAATSTARVAPTATKTIPSSSETPAIPVHSSTIEDVTPNSDLPPTPNSAVHATFEVEVMTLTVTLPDGAVPDKRPASPAPAWSPASARWEVPECGCTLGFIVQTLIPPRYKPDLVKAFESSRWSARSRCR